MHKFRCLLATFIAMIIASPLCCCAAPVQVEKQVSHSCCGSHKKEKKESACNCGAHTPRMIENHAAAPDAPIAVAAPPAPTPLPSWEALPAAFAVALPVPVDTGPPRWRLAMLQRFLI